MKNFRPINPNRKKEIVLLVAEKRGVHPTHTYFHQQFMLTDMMYVSYINSNPFEEEVIEI